ncbi:beta-propeller fold lactonase family protein [Neoroseomonas eburnea]|nr:beta-propeller fold lactonase family protein [Neoroseomonas eburnea]
MPEPTRRELLSGLAMAGLGAAGAAGPAEAQAQPAGPQAGDGVWLCNEDSNTLTVVDPVRNVVAATVNLTSFDEDPRPPFRFVTGGVIPPHGAMVQKPLYHGAISIHGSCPSPDSRLIATTGRGSSNVYLIETETRRVVGNRPNTQARDTTNPERLTSGIFLGREPHEPTFTRNGRELWVTVRGEDRIAVLDVARAREESAGGRPGHALRGFIPTMPGPAHAWFSADGRLAVVVSQKAAVIDLLSVDYDAEGLSRIAGRRRIEIAERDPFGFSPFLKLSPDGGEIWTTHKLADRVSVLAMQGEVRVAETIQLPDLARPNHVEFVENARGRFVYVSYARVDDDGPDGIASSRIGVIDRSAPAGRRRVVADFHSGGREAHGLWTDPTGTRLYVAHEQDELPNTPHAGQTVCSAFDVSDPVQPRLLARIPLGDLALPSGRLRSKKSINLVYVRPGARSATA